MRKRKMNSRINNGAIADISFLLLIFFMVVTTFSRDFKLDMNLPPKSDATDGRKINAERLMKLYLNASGEMLFDDLVLDDSNYQEFQDRLKTISSFKKEGKLLIHIHPESEYHHYLELLNNIKRARNKIRNEIAKQRYKLAYYKLKRSQKDLIDKEFRFSISEKQIEMS